MTFRLFRLKIGQIPPALWSGPLALWHKFNESHEMIHVFQL